MRVIVSAASYTDGCAFYRSTGPWSEIAKANRDISVQYLYSPNWAEVRSADVLFLQRPCDKALVGAVNAAKDFGVKVVVDYDDDLFELPRDNPQYEVYVGLHEQMEKFIRVADLVMVSTERLFEKFIKWNKSIEIVPNALDDCLLKYRVIEDQQNIVLWRGTDTHNRDVATYSREIVEVSKKFPEYRFAFVGCDPAAWMTSELMDNPIRVTTKMTPVTLFHAMATLRPKVMMVPLADSGFNRSKSNIASLEGTLAGAASLVPAWTEWSMDGVTKYKNPTEFREGLERLLSGSLNTRNLADSAWEFVRNNLMLSRVNEKRLRVVKSIL